jgi:hypothetical protein
MLEIKLVILGKLAINKNHFKGLVKAFRKEVINFNKRVKEVIKALIILKY